MHIDYQVPFYANTPDDTHCFQAALRMILKYVRPNDEYSWAELEIITAKGKDLWTWPTAALIWLISNGFEIRVISPFDYKAFIEKGGDFLLEKYGQEVGEASINHSNIPQEQRLAQQLISTVPIEKRIPTIKDIDQLLHHNYLIICNVNSNRLNHKPGYTGHSVVIKGVQKDSLIIHDPGLPPIPNRVVSRDDFEAAWAYPNDDAKEIYAIRPVSHKQSV